LATWIVGAGAAAYLLTDMTRLSDPSMNRRFVRLFRVLMRPSEVRAPTGTAYYLLGAFFSILLFSPMIAIASTLFLVFGDFTAALVGTSIGRIRIFPPRSLEGSAGCLVACLVVGLALFWHVKPVWPVAVTLACAGAAAATVAEGAPWRLNDNVTIPLISGLALRLAARGLGVVDIPLPW
jgi:glycerol-3-phosphate acyltransferase PlsY